MSHPPGAAGLSLEEQAALDAIDLEYLTAFLSELVSLPSTGGNETPAQERVATELEALGAELDVWEIDLDELRSDPDCSEEVERTEALGVVGRFGSGESHLMLNGHIDVVPVGDASQWTVPPWSATTRNGLMFGRGTADMKGGLACALAAVRAVVATDVDLRTSVSISSVVGEEDGGLGTLATILRGHVADGVIVLEPTNGEVSPRQAGALGFRITVPGSPAHGALRGEGVSAIEKFEVIHRALSDLERKRNGTFSDPLFAGYEVPLALSIGTVRAGEWSSTVPDTLLAEGRYGVAPGESLQAAKTAFTTAVADAAAADPWLADHPPLVEWWGGQFRPASSDVDSSVAATVASAHRTVTGAEPPVTGVPYGSDLRHFVNRVGIPTVLYGPGDVRWAHRADERVPLADLERVACSVALCLMRFPGEA